MTIDTVTAYLSRGFAVVHIPPQRKFPAHENWNRPGGYFTESTAAVAHWKAHPRDNLGVVLEPSQLCSLDADQLKHTQRVLAELGIGLDALIKNYPTIQGHPERRRITFKAPTGVALARKTLVWPGQNGAKETTVFELRAGLVQDVWPPSIHPDTGQPYRWITPLPEGDLPELPTELLELWQHWEAYKDSLVEVCPWATPKEKPSPKRSTEGVSVIAAFNQGHSVESLLSQHGYKRKGKRWLAPSSSTKIPGVSVKEGRVYSHHGSDPLGDGYAHDSFDAYRLLEHSGDFKEAVKAAAKLLGMEYKAKESGKSNTRQDTLGEQDSTEEESSWPEPLAEAAFHGLAGDVVRAIDPSTEADPAAVLIQYLAAFGNAIGRQPHYRIEGDYHTAILFLLLVGLTAKGRKGTSAGRVRQVFALIEDPWEREHIVSGLSSGEGLIWAVRDPIHGREKVGKGKEARYEEVETDPGVRDKRLLIIESEFASTLKVMGREGNTLSPIIRQAWDSGNLRTMVKNNPAKATGAHISIVGHITADELRRYLDRTECGNGFANRFLFVCVKRSKCLPHGGQLEHGVLKDLAQRTARAIGLARVKEQVTMAADARRIWEHVYPALSEGGLGLLGAVTSRSEAQVIRLALLYALLDCSTVITPEHLKAALAVWDYAEESARYLFGGTLGDPLADEILQALRANPEGLTRTDIRDLFGRNKSSSAIERTLALLRQQGKATCAKRDTQGRPVEVWKAL